MRNKLNTVILILLIISSQVILAQERDKVSEPKAGYGVFGNLNLNNHTADFRGLPGVPSCCPQYASGDGTGFSFGLLYEIPFSQRLALALRGSYATHSALLQSRENTTVGVINVPTSAVIEHSLDAHLSSAGLEPLLGYKLFGGLSLNAGLRIGLVLQKKYNQKEVLIEPAGTGTFENGLRTRNPQSGDIPDASSLYGAVVAGLSFRLPLNGEGTLFLVPEALYAYGITPVANNLTWNTNTLRGGVAIIYSPRPEPVPIQPPLPPLPPPPPPKPPEKPVLAVSVTASGVDENGNESPMSTVVVGEFISAQFRPMLNYVFFEENEAKLPPRYNTLAPAQAASFNVNSLHLEGTLDVHHQILNIVGKRMQENQKATITITGCNSNTGAEKENVSLSRARAETVRDYLKQVWNIAENRMKIEARNLSSRPSGSDQPDGIAENQRVELTSNAWEIIEPIQTRDFERQVTPVALRFHPSVQAKAGIANWTLILQQEGKQLKTLSGIGDIPENIDWQISREQESIPRSSEPLEYTLAVTDKVNQITSTKGTLRVEQKKVDKEVGRYSLILFDFDQATLNDYNRRIARSIQSALPAGATIKIAGYTDRIGEAEHNQKLSEERAKNTASALGVKGAQVEGVGESVLLYDNDLPEGRFYSRTVNVLVEKEGGK